MLDSIDESQAVKRAYLSSVLPKQGLIIYDDAGRKLDFRFRLNDGMARGWTGVDKDGNTVCLSDSRSGYDGKDISVILLAKFLKDWGYELVDER